MMWWDWGGAGCNHQAGEVNGASVRRTALLCTKLSWKKTHTILVMIRKGDWRTARLEKGRPGRELLLIYSRKVIV